ncbi:hypothetical protein Tco_1062264, partial [Tanacetum coccineum]
DSRYKESMNVGEISISRILLIIEYLVKIRKKTRILELKRRNMKIIVLTSYTPYPSRKIWRICACISPKTTREQGSILIDTLLTTKLLSDQSIMAEPLSPDHVFGFPTDDAALDLEDPEMEVEEDPKEEPEEDPKEVIPLVVASTPGSLPISPQPLSKSSSDFEFTASVTSNGRLREDTKTLYGSIRTLEQGKRTCRTEIATTRTEVDRIQRRMDAFDIDLDFIEKDATMTAMMGVMEACPSKSIDVLAVYGDARHSESLMANRVAEAITEYERNQTNPERAGRVRENTGGAGENVGGAGGAGGAGVGNARGNIEPKTRECTYKAFLGCNPLTFNGTEGA